MSWAASRLALAPTEARELPARLPLVLGPPSAVLVGGHAPSGEVSVQTLDSLSARAVEPPGPYSNLYRSVAPRIWAE